VFSSLLRVAEGDESLNENSTPYRVGLVGAGGVSEMHLAGMMRHANRMKVVALCDPDQDRRTSRSAAYGIPETFAELDAFIRETDMDAAIVCTPTHVRTQVLFPLIEAGIPVLCEKPLAETYAEAAAIEAKAREHGVAVAVNQNFRRFFSFSTARRILAEDRLGRPLHLTQIANSLRRDQGWRLQRTRYVMAVMSVHWFDGYRYLLDDEAETVYCRAVDSPATPGRPETAVSVIIQFRKRAVASLTESFSSYAGHAFASLDCEAGGLILDYGSLVEVRESGKRIEHVNPFDKPEATYLLLEDLVRAVAARREPATSASDNLKTMRIVEAAYESLEQDKVVRVEDVS